MTFVAQRARDHPEGCEIVLIVGIDRHVVVEIPHHSLSLDHSYTVAKHLALQWKDRDVQLTSLGRNWRGWGRRHRRMVSAAAPVYSALGVRWKLYAATVPAAPCDGFYQLNAGSGVRKSESVIADTTSAGCAGHRQTPFPAA